MNRLVIINDASVARGGATGLAVTLANSLSDAGWDVTFFSGASDGRGYLNDNVDLVELSGKHLLDRSKLMSAFVGLFNYSAYRALKKWIDENDNPNIVYHVHGWSKYLSPSIFLSLKNVWERVFIHAHDFFLACPNGGFVNYQKMEPCRFRALSWKCVATNCDKRSYAQKLWRVTRSVVLRLLLTRRYLKGKIIVLHKGMFPYFKQSNFSELDLVEVVNPSTSFTTHRIQSEKNSKIFYIGRLDYEKGVTNLAVAAKQAGADLEFIGEGPEREELSQKFPEFPIHGWLKPDDISRLIVDARALVVPSRYPEPFGLVIAEAIKSGIPVVVSEDAILASEILEKNLGFVYSAKGDPQLHQVLEKVLSQSTKKVSEECFREGGVIFPGVNTWLNELTERYRASLSGAEVVKV